MATTASNPVSATAAKALYGDSVGDESTPLGVAVSQRSSRPRPPVSTGSARQPTGPARSRSTTTTPTWGAKTECSPGRRDREQQIRQQGRERDNQTGKRESQDRFTQLSIHSDGSYLADARNEQNDPKTTKLSCIAGDSSRPGPLVPGQGRELAEHWAVCDDLTTMLQLGILQPRPANNEPSAAVGVAEMPEDPSLSRDQARGIGQHSGWTDTLHDTPLARAGY